MNNFTANSFRDNLPASLPKELLAVETLGEIPLDEEIKDALLEREDNEFSLLYNTIQSYEKGDWEAYSRYVTEMGLNDLTMLKAYQSFSPAS